MRSKCNWYKDGKKSSKFFKSLEKNRVIQNQICLLKIGEKEIKDLSKILRNLYQLYEELFSKEVSSSVEVIAHYLKDISLPKLSEEQNEHFQDEVTKN